MKPKLVIADSDTDLCHVFQRFLTDCGYEVEIASDGLSCMEKVRRLRPAALVLDRELSWGRGDGVLAWLREEWSIYDPAVVLTASARYVLDVAVDLKPPVVRFLPKPFLLRDLLETLQNAVAKSDQKEWLSVNRSALWSELYLGQ
jgi:two-component system OmpR family response regulator